jgi:DNA-binding NtrC family response regulator
MVILDYNLDSVSGGVINGIQVLNKLKDKYPKVPVVFLSGQERSDIAANTMKHGAADYIIKNENVFMRLEIAMKNILGLSTNHQKRPASRVTSIVFLVIVALIILGVIAWRSMK